jgi:hypothetical protein
MTVRSLYYARGLFHGESATEMVCLHFFNNKHAPFVVFQDQERRGNKSCIAEHVAENFSVPYK